jgi:hypothetical protein
MINFTFIDFYLTAGNSPNKPLALNGLPFHVKLGVLVNSKSSAQIQGGSFEEDRVKKRIRTRAR